MQTDSRQQTERSVYEQQVLSARVRTPDIWEQTEQQTEQLGMTHQQGASHARRTYHSLVTTPTAILISIGDALTQGGYSTAATEVYISPHEPQTAGLSRSARQSSALQLAIIPGVTSRQPPQPDTPPAAADLAGGRVRVVLEAHVWRDCFWGALVAQAHRAR